MAILIRSTPSLAWVRISARASARLVTSRAVKLRRADAAREPVVEALPVGDHAAAGGDPRALEEPGIDRVAHRDAELAAVAGADHRGDPGGEHVLGEEQPAQGAEFVAGPDIDVFLALRVAEGEVGVHVDQSGHDELGAQLLVARLRAWCLVAGAEVADQAVLDDQGLVGAGLQAGGVEQVLAVQVQGAHGLVPVGKVGGRLGRPRRRRPADAVDGRPSMPSIAAPGRVLPGLRSARRGRRAGIGVIDGWHGE
jgi:hypothetical protein